MADTTDDQVLQWLRDGLRPNALKNKFGVSVGRSKRIAAEHGIDLRPSVGRADPTDGPTDPPTDGFIDAARRPAPAPTASIPPSVGVSVGPTPLLTGLLARVAPCIACGVVTPKAELTNDRCGSCGSDAILPAPAPRPSRTAYIIMALAKADAALTRVKAYKMFEDKRYRPFMAEINDAIDAVRAAIKEL